MQHPIVFIVIILVCILLLVICYIKSSRIKKPLPPDARCRNCRTTVHDWIQEIYCNNKKSDKYCRMVDDFHQCRLWKGKRVRKCRK